MHRQAWSSGAKSEVDLGREESGRAGVGGGCGDQPCPQTTALCHGSSAPRKCPCMTPGSWMLSLCPQEPSRQLTLVPGTPVPTWLSSLH